MIHVALHHGTGMVARAIQWQTRSHWNHVSLVHRGILWEAVEGHGVINTRRLADVRRQEEVALFRIHGFTLVRERHALAFLLRQLGKPYDYGMVARFITRQQATRKESGKWFCSELAFTTMLEAGVPLLERIDPWAVSPQHVAISPLLIPEPALYVA